jgi:hypothetical protein
MSWYEQESRRWHVEAERRNQEIIERMRQAQSSSSRPSQPPRHHSILGIIFLLVLIASHRLRRATFWAAVLLGIVGLVVAFISPDTENLGMLMIVGGIVLLGFVGVAAVGAWLTRIVVEDVREWEEEAGAGD